MHASHDLHADTFACAMHSPQEPHAETPMHATQETKIGPCTSDSLMSPSKKNLQQTIGYLNYSWKNTQFQKNSRPKQNLESEVIDILNSTVIGILNLEF
jgi:hypothetical protein